MQELFDHSFSMVNIVPTFLLFFSLLYWVIVMLGAIDLDFFDIDIDLDTDVPDDVTIGWLNSVLIFFNLAQIPLMIFITFLALPMWFIGVVGNYYLGVTNVGLSLLILIPNFIVSLFIAKFATMPFVKLFTRLKKEETSMNSLTGNVCKVLLVATYEQVEQAEVKQNVSSFLINTKSTSKK